MTPTFRLITDQLAASPVLATEPDGSPRTHDGVTFYNLEQAAAATGRPTEELEAIWRASIYDQADLGQQEVVIDAATGEAKPLEFESLTDQEIVDRARRRHRGTNDADQWSAFVVMARAMGYSVDAKECYPGVAKNEETGEEETICVAKLEALQRRVSASQQYNGMDGPYYCAKGGEWKRLWDEDGEPYACRILLYRKGVDRPHEVVGRFEDYAPPKREINGVMQRPRFWRERPLFMLSKCLEAEALRKLFRDVVGNVYIPEEINDPGPSPSRSQGRPTGPKPVAYSDDAELARDDVEDETISSEAAARRAMTKLGVGENAQNRFISSARETNPLGEDDAPDAFWGGVVGMARQAVGGGRRRGSR